LDFGGNLVRHWCVLRAKIGAFLGEAHGQRRSTGASLPGIGISPPLTVAFRRLLSLAGIGAKKLRVFDAGARRTAPEAGAVPQKKADRSVDFSGTNRLLPASCGLPCRRPALQKPSGFRLPFAETSVGRGGGVRNSSNSLASQAHAQACAAQLQGYSNPCARLCKGMQAYARLSNIFEIMRVDGRKAPDSKPQSGPEKPVGSPLLAFARRCSPFCGAGFRHCGRELAHQDAGARILRVAGIRPLAGTASPTIRLLASAATMKAIRSHKHNASGAYNYLRFIDDEWAHY
jgi:hypothetical protein